MWLDLIQPFTKKIIINKKEKFILLVHPHFDRGTTNYKKLIHALINSHSFPSYSVECVGFASIYGFNILDRIYKHLINSKNIDHVHLDTNIMTGTYRLYFKFKGE